MFNQAQIEHKEVKIQEKPRKAPLWISHGGPTTILKRASEFIEKDKLHSLIHMETMFENINKKKITHEDHSRSTGFSQGISNHSQNEGNEAKIHKQEREFLHLITERLTKKMFLAKQKQKFLKEIIMKK